MCEVKNVVLTDEIVTADCYPSGDPNKPYFFLRFNIHTGECYEGYGNGNYSFYDSDIIAALRHQYKTEGKLPESRSFMWY